MGTTIGKGELLGRLLRDRVLTWVFACVTLLFLGFYFCGISLYQCPFLAATKLPCPGCGLTRSCAASLRGDLSAALDYHLFGPVILLLGLAAFLGSFGSASWRLRTANRVGFWERKLRIPETILTLLLGYTLTRWVNWG